MSNMDKHHSIRLDVIWLKNIDRKTVNVSRFFRLFEKKVVIKRVIIKQVMPVLATTPSDIDG